jgi:glycosyltransferase involved in cell wall biosynthesis
LKMDADSVEKLDVIDGISYHRQPSEGSYLNWTLEQRLLAGVESLVSHCENEGIPEVLHAASNWMNGLTAVHAGRILGVPVVYEIRGLWELTRTAKDPGFEDSEHFQMISRMEVEVAMAANRVIAITEGLRAELIERGVPAKKIRLAQNGVDTERFQPLQRDMELAEELGIPDGPVIGYVGSLVHYEGLHLLLEAVSQLRSEGKWKGSVLIVGDGECRGELEMLAKNLDIADICLFTGRVDFREVERYYSLIDIAPFPRLPLKVCELVSPLKPFEAMAMGKTVIASDVAAMKEFIISEDNGVLFEKGSVDSLAEVLGRIIEDDRLREKLAASSRQWVIDNRTWRQTAEAIARVHDEVRPKRQTTILIAGHDLKFIYEMGREFIRRGYTVLEDNWDNHTRHDVELSKRLLKAADFVVCEWALGNARWYAEHIQSHQKLFFRLHLQEVDTEHLDDVNWNRVNKVVFIAPHVHRKAIERFGIPRERTILIPNFVDTRRFDVPKTAASSTTIGFMGIVPKRKRFDLALTVLEGVRAQHPEFKLSTKGKRPEEYAWMVKRTKEMAWYQHEFRRIEQSSLLRSAIRYQGWTPSPYSWFGDIGFLLSVSDFEGSHQAVAEGAASGAIPIILRWEGADEVYPPSWCVDTIEEGIERILDFNERLSFEERELARMKVADHIRENFDLKIIANRWLEMMDANQSS